MMGEWERYTVVLLMRDGSLVKVRVLVGTGTNSRKIKAGEELEIEPDRVIKTGSFRGWNRLLPKETREEHVMGAVAEGGVLGFLGLPLDLITVDGGREVEAALLARR
jgi:hypothetical protein